MRGAIRVLGLLFWMSGFPHAAVPQERPPSPGYRIRVDVDSVFLNVSVRDRYNRSIPRLQKDDFVVYEDGIPQRVDQMVSEEAPFNTLLLLDNSGSTKPFLGVIKGAAIEFTRCIKPNDQVAIATFNSLVELVQDFTDYRPTAERAIERIDSIGGTALYDSLLTCIDYYMRGVPDRGAIVVFTDGVDNQLEGKNSEGSKTPFPQLYRRIQEVDPVIYTIFLDTGAQVGAAGPGRSRPPRGYPGVGWPLPSPPDRDERPSRWEIYATAREQLYQVAEQTGGRMYSLTSVDDLSRVYREIAEDLSVRYQIGYNPTSHTRDGKWHQIRVQIRNRPDLAVRARKGYYAQD